MVNEISYHHVGRRSLNEQALGRTGFVTNNAHSDHLGQFYESSLGCMPTDYFRKRQQQPP